MIISLFNPKSPAMNSKVEVMQNWFDRVWTQEDTSFIREGFVPVKPENPNTATGLNRDHGLSPEEFEEFQQAFLGIIGEVKITIDWAAEQGEWLITRCTVNAISRKTEKPVEMSGCCIAKIRGDKILAAHNYFDFLHLFEGLELLPENTFARCLSGQPALSLDETA